MHIKLGADPEIILGKNNVLRSASSIFNFQGVIGRDGCATLLELRPPASDSPSELIMTLGKLIVLASNLSKCELFAGHYQSGYSIGGHLHYGSPEMISSNYRTKVIRALDTMLIPLSMMIDDQAQKHFRVHRGSYGRAGSYETKSYGFEYRQPCSWLLCPEIAFAYVTLGAYAAYNSEYVISNFLPVLQTSHPKNVLLKFCFTAEEYLTKNIDNSDTKEDIILLSKKLKNIINTGWNWNVNIVNSWKNLIGDNK